MRAATYAYHRQVENAWLVRDRDRRRLRELAFVVLAASTVVLALLVYTWLNVRVLETAYRIDELEGSLTALERRRATLALEEARATALPVVESRAMAELGMVSASAAGTVTWEVLNAPREATP
ncbi:MAG TPA: hypothetical protein VM617_06325 [Thermoanaerobaculia bacterium]|nr:hypothetical protein [Thermoanaerobaculia bacterium]